MSTLTIRLPDDTAERLKDLARHRGLSMNKLVEKLTTQAITSFDVEARFRAIASLGNKQQALEILNRLDRDHPGKGN